MCIYLLVNTRIFEIKENEKIKKGIYSIRVPLIRIMYLWYVSNLITIFLSYVGYKSTTEDLIRVLLERIDHLCNSIN